MYTTYRFPRLHALLVPQVEERLRFYEEGVAPRKNLDVMHEVLGSLKAKEGDEAAAAAPDAGRRSFSIGIWVWIGGRGRWKGRGQ